MKFKFLTGDVNWRQYGGKFISKKLNNGDFDYWLVLNVTNMHDATGDESIEKYDAKIQAVSPQAAGQDKVNQALSACGFSDAQLDLYENNPVFQAEALSDYGIFALLWHESGNNINDLMKQARKEADLIESLFGLYMDRRLNGLGQTGWNLIAGQDIREFLGGRS